LGCVAHGRDHFGQGGFAIEQHWGDLGNGETEFHAISFGLERFHIQFLYVVR
jgi:hypothetical protein